MNKLGEVGARKQVKFVDPKSTPARQKSGK